MPCGSPVLFLLTGKESSSIPSGKRTVKTATTTAALHCSMFQPRSLSTCCLCRFAANHVGEEGPWDTLQAPLWVCVSVCTRPFVGTHWRNLSLYQAKFRRPKQSRFTPGVSKTSVSTGKPCNLSTLRRLTEPRSKLRPPAILWNSDKDRWFTC